MPVAQGPEKKTSPLNPPDQVWVKLQDVWGNSETHSL